MRKSWIRLVYETCHILDLKGPVLACSVRTQPPASPSKCLASPQLPASVAASVPAPRLPMEMSWSYVHDAGGAIQGLLF